jgi:hypothetical protein
MYYTFTKMNNIIYFMTQYGLQYVQKIDFLLCNYIYALLLVIIKLSILWLIVTYQSQMR